MIRVLLADDENLIRTALASLLAIQDDLEVVAQAASGDEALAMARRHRPDVAVLDLQMPGLDGIAVAEQLVTELPACGSLILTSYGRPGHLKRALAAGVRGFLPKTVSAQVLADVVRTVHRGGRYVDPELAADAISAGDSPLTPREADVLELAAGGAPVDEIAKRAALTPGTVRNYLSLRSRQARRRQPPRSRPARPLPRLDLTVPPDRIPRTYRIAVPVVTGEGQGRSEQATRPSASGTIRPAAPAASKRDGRITIWVSAESSLISAVRRSRRPRVSTATYWDCGR